MLYIDTAKTSSLEGAATTVYAQGGMGNPRLIGWDGEKTLTLTIEDALLSPVSFAMLSGAGLVKGSKDNNQPIYVHTTYDMFVEQVAGQKVCKLTNEDRNGATLVVSQEAPVYPVTLDSAGGQDKYLSAITDTQVKFLSKDGSALVDIELGDHGEIAGPKAPQDSATDANTGGDTLVFILASDNPGDSRQDVDDVNVGDTVRIDCYEVHYSEAVEMQIDAENFAGYYYIEASTLFRDEATGVDLPAEFVIPRGKIQSNFTLTMANSGDPSTFTFTIDCFPAYTKFNKKKKVMALLQVINQNEVTHNYKEKSIMGHQERTNDTEVYDWYTKSVFGTPKKKKDVVGE